MVSVLLLLFSTGCKKFLDTPTPGATSNIPPGIPNANALVTGCYATFMDYDQTAGVDNWVEGWFCQWLVNEECSDDIYKGGDSHGDFQMMEDLGYFRTGYNQAITWKWRKQWIGIARCNNAIQRIPGMANVDKALADRLVAEAKFLRAFFYFELVRDFGDVPIILMPINVDNINQPRKPIKDVYEQVIEKSLTEAAAVLPEKDDAGYESGRASKGAALSLLAKAYLYQKKWDLAFSTFDKVVVGNKYQLEPNYRKIFDVSNVNGIESVFEIPYSGNQTFPFGWVGASALGSRNDGSWGWMQPSTDLEKEFESGDPRLQLTIIRNGDTFVQDYNGNPYPITPEKNNQAPYTAPYKYYIPKSKRQPNQWLSQNYNLQVIRYADVLLMYAESALQSGKGNKAADAVEQVRARARKMATLPGVLPAKATVTMDDIIHERRVELGTENHRFNDLRRWGIAQKVLNALPARIATYPEASYIGQKGALYQSPRNDHFAIPPLDVSKAGWQQNAGY